MEAWRQFSWLADRFPQARFILALRDPESWILDRLTRDGGAVARCHAHHRGCTTADLPDLWEADWHAHLAAVDVFFGTDPRLIRVDLDKEIPADLATRLAPLLRLDDPGDQQAWFPHASGACRRALLAGPAPAEEIDQDYVRDVASFACGAWGRGGRGCRGFGIFFHVGWRGDGR
ncbi:hypothetical protein ACFSYD_05175 [Paracoccus aerius]